MKRNLLHTLAEIGSPCQYPLPQKTSLLCSIKKKKKKVLSIYRKLKTSPAKRQTLHGVLRFLNFSHFCFLNFFFYETFRTSGKVHIKEMVHVFGPGSSCETAAAAAAVCFV